MNKDKKEQNKSNEEEDEDFDEEHSTSVGDEETLESRELDEDYSTVDGMRDENNENCDGSDAESRSTKHRTWLTTSGRNSKPTNERKNPSKNGRRADKSKCLLN